MFNNVLLVAGKHNNNNKQTSPWLVKSVKPNCFHNTQLNAFGVHWTSKSGHNYIHLRGDGHSKTNEYMRRWRMMENWKQTGIYKWEESVWSVMWQKTEGEDQWQGIKDIGKASTDVRIS